MLITVVLFNYHKFVFDIQLGETVLDLKERIQKRIGLNKYMHKLIYNSNELMDNDILKYKLSNKSIIEIVILTKNIKININ